MLALDVEQMDNKQGAVGVFGFSRFKPLYFNSNDYLKSDNSENINNQSRSEPNNLSSRIKKKSTTT
jgi:hypothetical protein